jgi:hypothetical protein
LPEDLTTTTGIAALAAGGLGLIALIFCIVLAVKLRKLRAAQVAVLGADGKQDLVTHAARLETGFTELREWVEDSLAGSEQRLADHARRIDNCIAFRSVVRYDAYNELSGAQSTSIALLDVHRSGVVISSIVHRDQARMYVKQLHEGAAEHELSPEEQQAVDEALSAPARVA